MQAGKRNGRVAQLPGRDQRNANTNGHARVSRPASHTVKSHPAKTEVAQDTQVDHFADDEPGAPEEEGDGDESFLTEKPSRSRGGHGRNGDRSRDEPSGTRKSGWYDSEVCNLIALNGSDELPGNRKIATPLWVLHYFNNPEQALLFGQLLYWFGLATNGRRRAIRREDGRSVIDKTHQQLADEIGVKNKRRIEGHLKAFKKAGLLGCRTTGCGRGRTTRIWLLPDGVARAYREGSRRAEETEDARHDKSGGS